MISIDVSVSKGWMEKALNVRFDRDYYFNPMLRYEIDKKCHEYAERELGYLRAFYTESNLGQKEFFKDTYVLVGGIQPNLIQGMLLGADFLPRDNMDADISQACRAGRDVSDLPAPESVIEDDLIRLFDSQICDIRNNKENDLTPIPPFFWDSSGRGAVHGPLTTAQKFLGQDVFLDLLENPARVMPLMNWICDTNILLVNHFAEKAGINITGIHVGECSACMISPELFEKYVVPFLSRMGNEVGPVRFHSCGQSNHIIEACSKIQNLYSLDLGGETSLLGVREKFGKTFPVSIAPVVTDLSSSSPEKLIKWGEKIIADNNGGELMVLYHMEPDYSPDVLRMFNAEFEGIV